MIDVEILNRLLEHKNFPRLISPIWICFQDTVAKGIMARNQLIELATASLYALMKDQPEHRAELSMNAVTAMIAGQIGQFVPMNEETIDQF